MPCLVLGVQGPYTYNKLHSKAEFWHPVSIYTFYKASITMYMYLCLTCKRGWSYFYQQVWAVGNAQCHVMFWWGIGVTIALFQANCLEMPLILHIKVVFASATLHWMVVPLAPLPYFKSILSAVVTSPISLSAATMCLQEAPGVLCSHKYTTSCLRRSISIGTSCSIWCSREGWSPNLIPSWYHLETVLSSELVPIDLLSPLLW